MPWEGVTLIGTTDIEHSPDLQTDASISDRVAKRRQAESRREATRRLLAAASRVSRAFAFPEQARTVNKAWRMSSRGGSPDPPLPPVSARSLIPAKSIPRRNPASALHARNGIIWQEDGLLTASGGKLSTFRLMARDVLRAARQPASRGGSPNPPLPERHIFGRELPVLDTISQQVEVLLANEHLKTTDRLRLLGRYAADAPELVQAAQPGELEHIEETASLWAELRWAARSEGIVHLDDAQRKSCAASAWDCYCQELDLTKWSTSALLPNLNFVGIMTGGSVKLRLMPGYGDNVREGLQTRPNLNI